MKLLKITAKILLGLLILILVFLAFTIAPVDRTDYRQMEYYKQMNDKLNSNKT